MGIEFQFVKTETEVSNRSIPKELALRLGSGLRIPKLISDDRWEVISGTQKVKQDIYIALATPVGVRMMQPDFGSLVPFYCFETFTPRIESQIVNAAYESLAVWVPQIVVKDVRIDDKQMNKNICDLIIMYTIKGSDKFEDVSIVLASPDTVQIPPGRFVIGGRAFFAVA